MNFLFVTYIFGLAISFLYILHHLYPSVKVKVYLKEDNRITEDDSTERGRRKWLQDQRDKLNNKSAFEE